MTRNVRTDDSVLYDIWRNLLFLFEHHTYTASIPFLFFELLCQPWVPPVVQIDQPNQIVRKIAVAPQLRAVPLRPASLQNPAVRLRQAVRPDPGVAYPAADQLRHACDENNAREIQFRQHAAYFRHEPKTSQSY